MSYFKAEFIPAALNDRVLPEEARQDPAPGVRIERRSLFKVGGAAALALLLGPSMLRAEKPATENGGKTDAFGPLSLKDFIQQADPLARALTSADSANEEAYLLHLGSLLCRLGPQPLGAEKPRGMMHAEHHSPYFMVVQINMAPGAALPFHDHRDYNGVILGLEGSVHARNYEILGGNPLPPKDQPFQIRQSVDAQVEPGRISTLTRKRDNIHDLRAGPAGARLLDVFTFFPGEDGSHYLSVDDAPVAGQPNVYCARWLAD